MKFTEMEAPPKERLIIRMHFTKVLEPERCEHCHMARVPRAGEKNVPPACAVCGRMLCWGCFGVDALYTAPNLKQYHWCDSCAELEIPEIDAVLELRARLSQL